MARTGLYFLVLIGVVLLPAHSYAQQNNVTVADGKPVPTLMSRGYGVVSARSDGATVSVSVEARNKTASAAREAASRTVQGITNSLDTAGGNIAVTTSSVSVSPEWVYDQNTSQRLGIGNYTYRNSLIIGIRNVTAEELAAVIDQVLSNLNNGQVSIDSISFGLSKQLQGKMWLEAREAAVADAYGSAKLYAEALGNVLGDVISFQELSAGSGPSGDEDLFSEDGASSSYTGAPVSIGQQTVTVQVEAVYGLKPGAFAPAQAPAASPTVSPATSSVTSASGPATATGG